jgi:hypothetical protein
MRIKKKRRQDIRHREDMTTSVREEPEPVQFKYRDEEEKREKTFY